MIDQKSLIDADVKIGSGVRIENSVIGRNCKIDHGVQVIDSVVWSGNTIDSDARVIGSLLKLMKPSATMAADMTMGVTGCRIDHAEILSAMRALRFI